MRRWRTSLPVCSKQRIIERIGRIVSLRLAEHGEPRPGQCWAGAAVERHEGTVAGKGVDPQVQQDGHQAGEGAIAKGREAAVAAWRTE